MASSYDLITLGRSSIDLYAHQIGAAFVDIKQFDAFVGGSPLNIAVGCQRLGLRTALLSAVGRDQVGDFLLKFLKAEGVETRFMPRIAEARTSAVLLGIEPPDRFPLVYYRENCADIALDLDHVLAAPIAQSRLLEISGTALSKDPSRTATFLAVEQARAAGVPVVLDLDFRADQWRDVRAFGLTTRALLRQCTLAIGTEEEVLATVLTDPRDVTIRHQQMSAPEIQGDVDAAIDQILALGLEALIVKRGALGASYHLPDGRSAAVPGFPVEVLNILGAGDAFASGFIYGYLQGWDWYKACRMGNAAGAVLVTRQGCANFMPDEAELMTFIEEKGGF